MVRSNPRSANSFAPASSRAWRVAVAISYVSAGAALRNLAAEGHGWDVGRARRAATAAWNAALGRARVDGGSPARMRMYYTALYHALLAPRTFDQDEEDGTVVLLTDEPAAGEEDAVRQAELGCPAAAIRVTG